MSQSLPATPESVSARKSEAESIALSPAIDAVEDAHQRQIESEDLTHIATGSVTVLFTLSSTFIFDLVPLDCIMKYETSANDLSYLSSTQQRRILLPTYDEACSMFDLYTKYICYFQHVLHLPALRRMLEDVYGRLSRKEEVEIPHVLLLLAVFSTVLMYTAALDTKSTTSGPPPEKEALFMLWFRYLLDLLDHCRRVLPGSLEIVQACVVILFLDYNLEGFTPRARSVLYQAIQTAKDAGMNRVDCPSYITRREHKATTDSVIDAELKRRVWWHITATDWMISVAGASHEGTYCSHPHQMRVRLPRNIDDEVLERGNTTEDLPLTTPTPMCYPLHRIRLADIMRNLVDTFRFGLVDPAETDYSQVLAIDKRIEHFLEDLPLFFKLDEESVRKSQYTLQRFPYFGMQRFILNVGAQTVRCKLHQPFIVRGPIQQYPQSTKICLNSAMEVIRMIQAFRNDPSAYLPERVRMAGLLHHMFFATVVLVMDLCFNGMKGTDDSRAVDVMTAIKMLEEAKHHSTSAQKFLDLLMDTLKKHQVRLTTCPQDVDGGSQRPQDLAGSRRPQFVSPSSQNPGETYALNVAERAGSQTTTVGFEDVWWEAINQGNMNTVPDWDTLFSELDGFIA